MYKLQTKDNKNKSKNLHNKIYKLFRKMNQIKEI
jgi:hypothetical protein